MIMPTFTHPCIIHSCNGFYDVHAVSLN